MSKRVVVLGGGPGGYAAGFRAADLGMDVTLINKEENPGGVCLYRGCIPSKALLHIAKLINEAKESQKWGVEFHEPKIDLDKLRSFKERVVAQMTGGLGILSKQRKINYMRGTGRFLNSKTIRVEMNDGENSDVEFDYAIISTGSVPIKVPGVSIDSEHVWDSTDALNLIEIPNRMLVVGGGYIGLELGSVYASLGSKITVVEMMPGLLPGADKDLVSILSKSLTPRFENVYLKTKVFSVQEENGRLSVTLEGDKVEEKIQKFDKALVSVGRKPVTTDLGLENIGVNINERGFIETDEQMRTSELNIFAIGDVVGQPMLAHKASAEGKLAVEVINGSKSVFDPNAIPAVVFTDPELAWAGLTETEAKTQGINYKVAKFPWGASGRATTIGRNDGLTKLLIDPETERVLGMGVVGAGAGELIAEGVLAIEMSALAKDVALSIHPHPTLSETVMESAEVYFGEATHLYRPKRN